MQRRPGVLIGSMRCGRCAGQGMRAGQSSFKRQTPLHAKIEQTLVAAYDR